MCIPTPRSSAAPPSSSARGFPPDAPGAPELVADWDGDAFAAALRHNSASKGYNLHFRQLLHVGYKVAAEMGPRFTEALDRHAAIIAENVTANLYERHIRPLFLEP